MTQELYTAKSPIRFVRADETIEECVRIMRNENIGALLVVSDNNNQEPLGIFTERDLLKHIETIQKGNSWKRAVRTVMSKPLFTIEPQKIAQAGKIMLERGIRHLPVASQEGERLHVIGMLSMRDLFKSLMQSFEKDLIRGFFPTGTAAQKKIVSIGLIAQDPAISQLLRSLFRSLDHILIKKIPARRIFKEQTLINSLFKMQLLFIDLDYGNIEDWLDFFKKMNELKIHPTLFLLHNPNTFEEKKIFQLKKIVPFQKIYSYSKPLDLQRLINEISPLLS